MLVAGLLLAASALACSQSPEDRARYPTATVWARQTVTDLPPTLTPVVWHTWRVLSPPDRTVRLTITCREWLWVDVVTRLCDGARVVIPEDSWTEVVP